MPPEINDELRAALEAVPDEWGAWRRSRTSEAPLMASGLIECAMPGIYEPVLWRRTALGREALEGK